MLRGLALAIAASLLAGAGGAQAPPALAELQSAARTGNAEAQFQLGEAYRTGTGVAADRDQAITWFKRAADQGYQPARDAMGMLLFTRGNRREAMPLIEAAAARGDARALYILATARFNGDYVARDWPRAYAEMSRAADLGLPQARSSLTQMEPYLLPADRAKADQIRATMAASAPGGSTATPPRATSQPPRLTATAVPAPAPESLGLPSVPANGAGSGAFDLASSPGASTRVSPASPSTPPPAPAPIAVQPAPPPPPRPLPRPVASTSPPRGAWRVQLGAYSSQDRAETQWKALGAKYASLARYTHAVTPAGAVFRLQAEGIAGREEAAALCRDVVAGGGGCFAVAP